MLKIHLLDIPTIQAKKMLDPHVQYTSLEDADIIYTQLTPITTTKPVFTPCTGIDHVHSPYVVYLNQAWKDSYGKQVTSTAEHTFSLILQSAKKKKIQLKDKTLGIIGLGRIGQMVLEYADGFNMKIIAIDPKFANEDQLHQLIKDSDIVTIHVPLNNYTRNLISFEQRKYFKPHAILVNTSRPEIVNEGAIRLLLHETDVIYANDFNQLSEYHSVIATPHIAGNSIDARIATDIYVVSKIIDYIGDNK